MGIDQRVQGTKRHKPAAHRKRAPVTEGEDNTQTEDEPSSSTAIPGTAGDPIPREEHLTPEGWAIMAAVERCTVWRALKSFNLRQSKKLLDHLQSVPGDGGGQRGQKFG